MGLGGVGWGGIITSMHLHSHALPHIRHGVGWGGVVGWDNNVNALAFSCTSTGTSCYAVDAMLKLCSCYVDAMFILR